MKPKKHWLVRKAKLENGRCWICGEKVAIGDSVTRYGRRWPHFQCAKEHDRQICEGS